MASKLAEGIFPAESLTVDHPDRIQVIKGFNARIKLGDLSSLETSIELRGVRSALWVRPDRANKAQPYILIAGERRLNVLRNLWARGVKDMRIPISVYNVDEEQAEELMILENLERKSLSASDFSVVVSRWEQRGFTKEEISTKLNRSESWVDQMKILAAASVELKNKVASEDVGLAVALDVARKFPLAEQSAVLDAVIAESGGKKSKMRKIAAGKTGTKVRPGKRAVVTMVKTLRDMPVEEDDVTHALVLKALEYTVGETTEEEFLQQCEQTFKV